MSISFGSKHLSLGSLFGALTAVFGVLSDPTVYAILPKHVAAGVTIAGVVIAAVSKQLVHTLE